MVEPTPHFESLKLWTTFTNIANVEVSKRKWKFVDLQAIVHTNSKVGEGRGKMVNLLVEISS